MGITARYASAVHSKSLRPKAPKGVANQTLDVDVLGAVALADKTLTDGHDRQGNPVKPAPLAVPLERLFSGDHRAAHEIVRRLASMAFDQSWEYRIKIGRIECHDMACACLAWYQHGTCRACGGHGYDLIPGVPALSSHECRPCRGTGKILFEQQFRPDWQPLARWLVAEMARESGRAGPEAMRSLAGSLDL